MKLIARFQPQTLHVTVGRGADLRLSLGARVVREYAEREPFAGPYTVTPSENVQTLATKHKRMTDNVTIDAIPWGLASTAQIDRLF